MRTVPGPVAEFLAGKRLAVAGVSRDPEVEGIRCYPDLAAIPGSLDGVLVATHPRVAADVVRQCHERGVARVWLHRSLGRGSVSPEAIRDCETHGIQCITGGCPMMYCEPVDVAHRCLRWWLGLVGRA